MINEVIESLRKQLYEVGGVNELTHEDTLKISEELNKFINFKIRTSNRLIRTDYTDSSVHANAILNILEFSAKKKFDLSYLIETGVISSKEWYKIDLVPFLLDTVSKKYGWDAVEQIGQFVPEKCIFPESVKSYYSSLQNLTDIYYLNHKSSTYIGEYLTYGESKSDIQMYCHTPHYPASFNHGIIKGLAKKFNHPVKIEVRNKKDGGEFKIVV